MTDNKPLILVTNDDGYQAKGIQSAIEALKGLGKIVVIAPDKPQSGMSGAITSTNPIRYKQISQDEVNNVTVYACSGTPVDCVKLGTSQILEEKPDILISGINHGSNSSICVLYSGTMGAAIEGTLLGIPSIGFSLLDHDNDADFSHTTDFVNAISKKILTTGLPQGVCLNVNIPNSAKPLKGIKICRQAKGQFSEEFRKSVDGADREVFWLTGYFRNHEPDKKDTDEWALSNGYISIVPTDVDMTAKEHLEKMKSLENLM